MRVSEKWKAVGLLTLGAILLQGYHPFAEDAEIYLPGVEKLLHPELFPVDGEFFASHASLTVFPNLIAFSLRITHLPFQIGLFVWHVASVFLLLLGCWNLAAKCFPSSKARWGGVALVAVLLTIPVAGTALYIMDQYLNPRNLAAFAAVFAISKVLEGKYARAAAWLFFAAAVHPLMAAFAFSFCALLFAMEKLGGVIPALGAVLPFGISLAPQTSRAYHEAALHHGFHYIQRWQWYEWVGIVAPLAILWWFGRIAQRRQLDELRRMCRALVIYGGIYFVSALVVDFPARFESLARLQPLRSLHLLYILMFLFVGGVAGEYLLKNRVWRWVALFAPLSLGMFVTQRSLFPASAQLEWPYAASKNQWAQAFLWIRSNAPVDAVFALDPLYMQLRGEDALGFRCLAERSRMADAIKDSGAVSMFPSLADEWWRQSQALNGWPAFQPSDFRRLKEQFGVGWVVLQNSQTAVLECPYRNDAVRVCRLQ